MNNLLILFLCCFVSSLVLTPLVRRLCKCLGMIDNPGHRRVNKVPIPRGGGLAIVIVMAVVYPIMANLLQFDICFGKDPVTFVRVGIISLLVALVGFIDDKFGLKPVIKLLFQIVSAAAVYLWAGLSVGSIITFLPPSVDFVITIFWIVGAINAFNLIDGLDGLASGIAFIASLGMAGALWFSGAQTPAVMLHCAFAAALLGFLRYNYHPASIFLGDTGSMFIGYTMALLPLMFNASKSFLVSIGVPLLAMGVPIFDTTLAILRRSLRSFIKRRSVQENTNGKVMTADADHIHHRILRATGFNQRKTAWCLYAATAIASSFGLFGVVLQSKAAALWVFAVSLATVVVIRSTYQIELFDAGRLINSTIHDNSTTMRRLIVRITVLHYVILDIVLLVAAFFFLSKIYTPEGAMFAPRQLWRMCLLQSVLTFIHLVWFNNYRIVWSRAMPADYFKLLIASFAGAVSGVVFFNFFDIPFNQYSTFIVSYTSVVFASLISIRLLRPLIRDLLYKVNGANLEKNADSSRILVYGTGLRFNAFYRQLVRGSFKENRLIVGLIDDDYLLSGRYIGGYLVSGTIHDAPKLIKKLNVDTVVIACEMTPGWNKVVMEILRPTSVKVMHFKFLQEEAALLPKI